MGTNLRLIRDAFPWVALSGSDLNVGAIEYARPRLPDVEFVATDALADSASWRPNQFDVLISCYTLAYLPPNDLLTFERRAVRAARQAILLAEPTAHLPGRVDGLHFEEWRHPHETILREAAAGAGRAATVRTRLLPQPVDRCNALTILTFTGEPK